MPETFGISRQAPGPSNIRFGLEGADGAARFYPDAGIRAKADREVEGNSTAADIRHPPAHDLGGSCRRTPTGHGNGGRKSRVLASMHVLRGSANRANSIPNVLATHCLPPKHLVICLSDMRKFVKFVKQGTEKMVDCSRLPSKVKDLNPRQKLPIV